MGNDALDDVARLALAKKDRDLFLLRQIAEQEAEVLAQLDGLAQLADTRSILGGTEISTAYYLQGEQNWNLWMRQRRAALNGDLMKLRVHKEMALAKARTSSGRSTAAEKLRANRDLEISQKARRRAFETVFDLGLIAEESSVVARKDAIAP